MLDESGFEKWAGNYDERIRASAMEFPFDGYYNVLAAVVSLVEPRPQMKLMDVGIGTGLLSEELKREGCLIHGVDFSGKMIEKARLRIPDGLFETADVLIPIVFPRFFFQMQVGLDITSGVFYQDKLGPI